MRLRWCRPYAVPGLLPGRWGFSLRLPRENGAACRLLARNACSSCRFSFSLSWRRRSRSCSNSSRCWRNCSFSLRSCSFSLRVPRHCYWTHAILRFNPSITPAGLSAFSHAIAYSRKLSVTELPQFVQNFLWYGTVLPLNRLSARHLDYEPHLQGFRHGKPWQLRFEISRCVTSLGYVAEIQLYQMNPPLG